jgi:hypothetical protein
MADAAHPAGYGNLGNPQWFPEPSVDSRLLAQQLHRVRPVPTKMSWRRVPFVPHTGFGGSIYRSAPERSGS